ncbi:hypothetical protein PC9H_007022 [Pleurotus ostreatus]|uniref:Cytochrome P450 n=1 Tax=Pleurotus ostreatus TaxID=5322 RepID=A0A8H6ZST2_PLEOS|nr:uncharacterized protein PC9H_007022 [Pleurotus ostreatus]KAF7427806.1 hypothetical protein PC9H_007022 [Pleurotus ostreatus]
MPLTLYAYLAILMCVSWCIRRTRRSEKANLPLPPGPKTLPFIGNLLDAPSEFQWIKYHEWSKQYDSDIIHLTVAGSSLIVIDTTEAAKELLDKRSYIYSSRPRFVMLNELMGWSWLFAMMEYSDRWKQHRKLFQKEFHSNTATSRFNPQILKHTVKLLQRLLESPDDFMEHMNLTTVAIIMDIGYAIDVSSKEDPHIVTAEKALTGLNIASLHGAFLVESIPLLKYVPSWIPWAGFQNKAKEWKRYTDKMIKDPFAVVKKRMAKAWREIDGVLKGKRLPSFEDMDRLPYVTAIAREVQRWQPVTPLAIPHFVTAEDEYKGYRIPANSIVIGNAWAMLHDDAKYPDPFAFKPERWLSQDGTLNPDTKEPNVVFGFGRRICPGRYLASSSIWITAAMLLSVFDFAHAVDEKGNRIEPSQKYCPGLIPSPLPFKCQIRPRSQATRALIQGAANA